MSNGARDGAGLRPPQAFDADDPGVTPSPPPRAAGDASTSREPLADAADTPTIAADRSRRARLVGPWGALFLSAAASLGLIAASLWFSRFVSVALAREDTLGLLANGLLILLLISALVIAGRELLGFWRLGRLSRLRREAERAHTAGERAGEEAVVRRLKSLLARRSDAAWAIARFRESERHMKAPGSLIAHADTVLMEAPDSEARRIVYESSRRVGIVTAMVPIAFLAMLLVLAEILRMVRRLAQTYGGRPGFLGGLKLFSWVLGHMAATGAVALTDDLIGQFFGQDLARRLSRRLGEGAFNAALTARLGVAAIDVIRPLPFIAAKRIRVRGILGELFPELKPGELMRATLRRGGARGGVPD